MNKEKAKQQLEALMEEAKKLEAIINAPEKALRLKFDELENSLDIIYGEDYIGFINDKGECSILNTCTTIDTYNQWRKDGMPVDSTPVKWRGKKYVITKNYYLYCYSMLAGDIYNFDSCKYVSHCQDDNIKRFDHNLKPIGF